MLFSPHILPFTTFSPYIYQVISCTYEFISSTLITFFPKHLWRYVLHSYHVISLLHTYHVRCLFINVFSLHVSRFFFHTITVFSPHLSHVISSGFTTLFSTDLCYFFYIYQIISCTIMTLFPLSRRCYSIHTYQVILCALMTLFSLHLLSYFQTYQVISYRLTKSFRPHFWRYLVHTNSLSSYSFHSSRAVFPTRITLFLISYF